MFVITFYSYKGGVGRTMSLVNVAAELAQRGRRVLLIDFDLEAPGIPSFEQFAASESRLGVVDYVSQYIETSVAPDVTDFIVETRIGTQTAPLSLWILPAGRCDPHYGTKLSSIDWQDLYQTRSGYLLFEDLKQQIESDKRKFDYVLIDSRTGHTDVGGICTRQLADAIAFMFFPNQQNISGLKTIVEEIRADRLVDFKRTRMLFCPSNVPDLDDEDGILRALLEKASRELGYDEPAATIRHYNSMSLVDQKIFVIDRPRTKLSSEYRRLTEALMELNIEDRDGVIIYLQKTISEIRAKLKKGNKPSIKPLRLNEITAQLEKINQKHNHDGEICWLMASAYHDLGDFSNEMEALTGVLNAGLNVEKAHLRRAFILLGQSRSNEARGDLLEVLNSSDTTSLDLRSAIEALKSFDSNWITHVIASPLLEKLPPEEVSIVSDALQSDLEAVPVASRLLEKAYIEDVDRGNSDVLLKSNMILAQISSGQFRKAMDTISRDRAHLLAEGDIQDVFNYAMAEWGESGNPPVDLFRRAVELSIDSSSGSTNFLQCLSLSSFISGDTDIAFNLLNKARKTSMQGVMFSCWTYLLRRQPTMLADLNAMEASFRSGDLVPPVITRKATES